MLNGIQFLDVNKIIYVPIMFNVSVNYLNKGLREVWAISTHFNNIKPLIPAFFFFFFLTIYKKTHPHKPNF